MTFGELMHEACGCRTKEEAAAFVERTLDWFATELPFQREKSRQILLENIGYWTGYLDREDAARILSIFETEHPVFGAIEEWPKTAMECFRLGVEAAKKLEAERR